MAHEKRLLVDVFEAYYYKKDENGNRKLVFMSENLTSGGITNSQETTDVRNGQGNKLFAVLPGAKDVTVNLTENVFSFESLQINTGANVETGASTAVTSVKSYRPGASKVNGKGEVEIERTPVNPAEMEVYVGGDMLTYNDSAVDQSGLSSGEFAVVTSHGVTSLVFEATEVALLDTSVLKIMPYVFATAAGKTSSLTIKSSEFAEGGELWLKTIEKDEKQKATAYVYFVFENAMPTGNFEISTQSEVQPTDMAVELRVIANEQDELYKIIREEV